MAHIVGKCFVKDEIYPVSEIEQAQTESVELCSLPLVVKKGTAVSFCGKSFVIDREGLYRFADYESRTFHNLICYEKDDFTLFASLCRLQVHGRADKGKISKFEQNEETAKTRRLSNNCAPFHAFCMDLMKKLGIKVRRVELLTLDEWNDYDNGHVLLEYFCKDEGRWIALDLDTRSLFLDQDGKYMNIYQLTKTVTSGAPYKIERICLTDGSDHADPLDTFHEEVHLLESGKKMWLKRIAHVPFICKIKEDESGRRSVSAIYPYGDEQVHSRVDEYCATHDVDFKGLPEKEWLTGFYETESE
ncbi:MAG: hypothetical protein ACYTFY_06545 [Planctomycetota bacterium]|jgi:hypothetical protein